MIFPRSILEYISRSTMKREIASLFLFWWMGVGTHLLIRVPVTQLVPDAALVTWAGLGVIVVGFATAAFGADWVSKQTNIAGPPSNTETTRTIEVEPGKSTETVTSEPKV